MLVDLPKNVLQGSAEFVWPEDVSLRSYNPTYRPNYAQIRKVVDALYNASAPCCSAAAACSCPMPAKSSAISPRT